MCMARMPPANSYSLTGYMDQSLASMNWLIRMVPFTKVKYIAKRRAIRSTLIGGTVNSYYSICFETADGRWFDNCGMPIEAPKKVEEEEQLETVEVQKVELTPEEKLANEQAFLSKLK